MDIRVLERRLCGGVRLMLEDSMDDILVAADVGNATTAVLVNSGETPTLVSMPSAASIGGAHAHDVFLRRGLPANAWNKLATDEHVIEIDGLERFVGRLALDSADVAAYARNSNMRYSDGWTVPFVLAGVAAAVPANDIRIRLVTGLPADLYTSQAEAVQKTFRRKWEYRYKGRDIVLHIGDVVVRREAEDMPLCLPESKRAGRIMGIDIGGRTTHVALYRDGRIHNIGMFENGVERALDDVDKRLVGMGLRRMTLLERVELLEAVKTGGSYHIPVGVGLKQRVDDMARQYFRSRAEDLLRIVGEQVDMAKADAVYVFGGGARFYGQRLQELANVELWTHDPELVNVQAYMTYVGGQPMKKGRKKS